VTAAPAGLEASARARPREPSFVLPLTILVALISVSPAFLVLQRPALVLFAFVVAVVVFLCALRADIALLLLVATAPLEGAIQIGSGSVLTISKLAGALAFSSFFLFALATKRKLLVDRSHAIIGLILALAMLSTLQARDVPQGLSTTIRYASFVALYLVVSQFANDHRLQRRIVWVLCAASTVAGLLTIRNFLNETTTQAALPYTNPNDTAFVLATTLPLAFWLLREQWVLRFAAIGMIGVMSASIVLSFSRGALVGLGAAALFQLLTQRKHILLLAGGVLVSVVTTIAFIQTNPGQVESGFEAKQRVAEYNVESRVEAWRGALDLIEAKPLLGVGPGNFREYYYEATGNPPGTPNLLVVHNAFLDIGAELGVAAMLLFIAYVGVVLRRATLAARAGSGRPGYATALRAALIVAVVSSLFLSEQYYAPLWLLGGLATALWRETKAAPAPAPTAP
jgi:putative inorganic carbon (HCO3(-)) transporter